MSAKSQLTTLPQLLQTMRMNDMLEGSDNMRLVRAMVATRWRSEVARRANAMVDYAPNRAASMMSINGLPMVKALKWLTDWLLPQLQRVGALELAFRNEQRAVLQGTLDVCSQLPKLARI